MLESRTHPAFDGHGQAHNHHPPASGTDPKRSLNPADDRQQKPATARPTFPEPQAITGPIKSAGPGWVEAVAAFADGRNDLGDPGIEGVEFFRLGRVGDERASVA